MSAPPPTALVTGGALTALLARFGLDADRADEFHENYEALSAELTALEERAAGIAASGSVAITEPVPLYLL